MSRFSYVRYISLCDFSMHGIRARGNMQDINAGLKSQYRTVYMIALIYMLDGTAILCSHAREEVRL